MTTRRFILATAGHVDHGKSALVKALTGTDPDRLPEEKARGITIDLGFAALELTLPGPEPINLHLGLVDVPGHENFVKNMVAGVGSIDLALLVVAADDGWMPQTEEHLQILAYLGVTRAVVALSKCDLVGDLEAATQALRRRLELSPLANAPIVPTSVVTGQGLTELKLQLAATLATAPLPPDLGKPRLPVDRVFTLRGIGTVVTGTLIGGTLHRRQAVIVQPSGQASRIRSLQSHNLDVVLATPGMRTALNLPDLEPRTTERPSGVARGDVVTLAELGSASQRLDVRLEKSARLTGSSSPAARPLKSGDRVQVHHASGRVPARVLLAKPDALGPGEQALAQLRLEAPLFAFVGDRLVVRDWAEQATLGGAIILDLGGGSHPKRRPGQQALLEQRGAAPNEVRVYVSSQVKRDHLVELPGLLLQSWFSKSQVTDAATDLESCGEALRVGDCLVETSWWKRLLERAAQAVEAEHRAHPERNGLALNQLRAWLQAELVGTRVDLFDAVLVNLCRSGFAVDGSVVRQVGHRPALPPQLQAAGTRLRTTLMAKPFEPPSRKELAPDGASQQALRFLLETGEVVELSPEVVLLSASLSRAIILVRSYLESHDRATVSDLRQVLGTTRRILVPLLERLDREGFTRREGDYRVLPQREPRPESR